MYRQFMLGLAALLPLFSQPPEYSQRIWRTQDGLPQNRIRALAQTADGYLWIGTPVGLARFDGLRFAIFDRSNTPALGDDSVLSLCAARDGELWIGTEGGGLVHHSGGVFRSYGARDGLSNGFVRALDEDSHGNLWIGTDRGYFLRSADGRIQRLDQTDTLPVAAIRAIQEDGRGRVWAASNIGLLVADGPEVARFLPGEMPPDLSTGLLASSDGTIWLSSQEGVWSIRNRTIKRLSSAGNTSALTFHEGWNGNVWLGTLGRGLLQLSGDRVHSVAAPALPDQTVLSILEDRDHSLWVGTQDGLVRMTRTMIRTVAARHGLPNDNVSSVYEDRDGSLWISTITARMSRLTGESVFPFEMPAAARGFRPRTVYRDRKGDLWFGSARDGLARVTASGAEVYTTREGLRNNSVRQILEDSHGRLWIALGSGLSRWDGQRFHNYYLEDGLAYGSVRALLEDRSGDLLVGTDGGVNRIQGTTIVDDKALEPLNGAKVWTIIKDPASGVWFGTRGSGVYRLRDGNLSHLTTRDGLASNNVYQLLDDQKGNLWMSGSTGIFSVSWAELNRVADRKAESLSVVSYGVAEGLESTEMNGGIHSAGCRTKSGDLWFASVKGAVRIRPSLPRPERRSRVLIEALRADGESIPLAGEISIPPGRRKLEIVFTVCDLLAADHSGFRYKLEGFDSGWTHDSHQRTAVYTNLPPASYRFRVSVLGANLPEASIAFVLQPHFYQTAWFLSMGGLMAVFAIWAAFGIYARQTRARYAVLLAERTRLAREMHDTVIQGCAGVSALLEAAAANRPQKSGGDKAGELVDQARIQIRLTLDEARQAVWDLRHTELEGDLASSLRDFAGRFSSQSAIPIGLEVSGELTRLDGRAERNLLLVASEAIRNALVHGEPDRIDLRLRFEPAEVCLEVSDDGRGFDPAPIEQEGHYGIVGMRERVEQLGGSLQIRSAPGRGTSLLARMPVQVAAK